ncbi:uncharacterized protein LOC118432082 [Branchiostoma floridae]|uniref:Uncharacterized protein LOC118432082 n=1 Tax=Branchiostoma floridae TaxID=7739 RepID=A0A9J7MEL6_BRAFL|nr:uncharacterized protein LOC118432082 [Branchiostoma floridae]
MKTVQPDEYEPNASSTPVPGSPSVTWHDVVDGTAGMIPNPMYCRRADLTPTEGKERRCKVGKASCVLWACLGTAAMLICVTAVVFAMVHHLQARVVKVENQMAEMEKALRGEPGPVGPPGPHGEHDDVGPRGNRGVHGPASLNPTSTAITIGAVKDGHPGREVSIIQVLDGSGEGDEGHFDSEEPDGVGDEGDM